MTVDLLKGYSTYNKKIMPVEKWLKIQDCLRKNKEYKEIYKDIGQKVPKVKL